MVPNNESGDVAKEGEVAMVVPGSLMNKIRGGGLYGIAHGWWVVICAVYIVSPIDLIPDMFPVIGWLDDAGIFLFLMFNLFVWLMGKMRVGGGRSVIRTDDRVFTPDPVRPRKRV